MANRQKYFVPKTTEFGLVVDNSSVNFICHAGFVIFFDVFHRKAKKTAVYRIFPIEKTYPKGERGASLMSRSKYQEGYNNEQK
ncbi:MAG: hypothetical protein COB78_11980 [Hyphomicrobiales bacterium]|nr:MAG: hypothetical protein COB78_11980 [Hyphomicrobiales bacterium]